LDVLKAFLKDDSGTTNIEYGLIAGLVSIAILAAVVSLGDTVETAYNSVNDDIAVAIGTPPPPADEPVKVVALEPVLVEAIR
jgi:pilus assembly protein Flp/PilA